MSARDDYPPIPNGVNVPGGWGALHLRMCAEIDRLRDACSGMSRHIVRHGNYADIKPCAICNDTGTDYLGRPCRIHGVTP